MPTLPMLLPTLLLLLMATLVLLPLMLRSTRSKRTLLP
jgi:hypothetical protein